MRLIDADALHMHIADCLLSESITQYEAELVHDFLMNAPTIHISGKPYWKTGDRHGKNISDTGFLCSECTFGDFGGFHGYEPNYCPNCGAKMEEQGATMNSRQKGARGERELAGILREYGYDSRRGQQYSGANGDADVVGLPGVHIECKRVEALNMEKAMEQARADARPEEIPAVFHRKNNGIWQVNMDLKHFMKLFRRANDK